MEEGIKALLSLYFVGYRKHSALQQLPLRHTAMNTATSHGEDKSLNLFLYLYVLPSSIHKLLFVHGAYWFFLYRR